MTSDAWFGCRRCAGKKPPARCAQGVHCTLTHRNPQPGGECVSGGCHLVSACVLVWRLHLVAELMYVADHKCQTRGKESIVSPEDLTPGAGRISRCVRDCPALEIDNLWFSRTGLMRAIPGDIRSIGQIIEHLLFFSWGFRQIEDAITDPQPKLFSTLIFLFCPA